MVERDDLALSLSKCLSGFTHFVIFISPCQEAEQGLSRLPVIGITAAPFDKKACPFINAGGDAWQGRDTPPLFISP